MVRSGGRGGILDRARKSRPGAGVRTVLLTHDDPASPERVQGSEA